MRQVPRIAPILALVASLAVPPNAQAASVVAPADGSAVRESDADTEKAKVLYDEGRKAYRTGEMEVALEKFTGAYELTELPIILYNIGLTYTRLYQTSNDVGHLRKAEVVLENFRMEVLRDGTLADLEEVDQTIAQVQEKIAKHEAGTPDNEPVQTGSEREENLPLPEGPEASDGAADPGRPLKLTGIGLMAGGGALGVGAAVAAVVIQQRYIKESGLLDDVRQDAEDAGCPNDTTQCDDFVRIEAQRVARVNTLRRQMLVAGIGLGVGGAALIGGGAAAFVIGKKRSAAADGARLRLISGPGDIGLGLTGQF